MKKKLYKPTVKYTAKMLDVLEQFGLGPKLELSGFDKDVIDVVSQIDDAGFYDLCECFDMRPSRMENHLLRLEDMGLVEYMDAAGKVRLTELAERYLDTDRKDTRSERKFRKFIECLTDDELDHFMRLADEFEIDESLLGQQDDEDEDASENDAASYHDYTIVDETEAEYDDEPEAAETVTADDTDDADDDAELDEDESEDEPLNDEDEAADTTPSVE